MPKFVKPEQLAQAEDELFGRWTAHRERTYPDGLFLGDGAMSMFARERLRVVFVLKEANDPDGRFTRSKEDLREMSEYGYDRDHTWRVLAKIAGIILEGHPRMNSKEAVTDVLRRIVCFNLKKMPGKSRAATPSIRKAAREDAVFIKEQIDLYDPSLVVCCGTFMPLQCDVYCISDGQRLEFEHDNGDIQYFFRLPNGTPVMDFRHPGQTSVTQTVLFSQMTRNISYLREKKILVA